MNPGDLRYTFTDESGVEQTIVVPGSYLKDARKKGLSTKQGMRAYLYDQGYLSEQPDMTPSASSKKTRTRKPNDTKRQLITDLAEMLAAKAEYATILNPERIVQCKIGDDIYEFTLVKKRPAK